MSRWRAPRILVLSWLALMGLLGLTVFAASQPLGPVNTPLALTIALCKALVVAAVFMELRRTDLLITAFACAGFFWVAILLWLALGDYLTRPTFLHRDAASSRAGERMRGSDVAHLFPQAIVRVSG